MNNAWESVGPLLFVGRALWDVRDLVAGAGGRSTTKQSENRRGAPCKDVALLGEPVERAPPWLRAGGRAVPGAPKRTPPEPGNWVVRQHRGVSNTLDRIGIADMSLSVIITLGSSCSLSGILNSAGLRF